MTFAEFIKETTFIGKPVSYHLEAEEIEPKNPFGTYGMVNCTCGSTLALGNRKNWPEKAMEIVEVG